MSKHSQTHGNILRPKGAAVPDSANEAGANPAAVGETKETPAAGAENTESLTPGAAPEEKTSAAGEKTANWELKTAELEAKLAELNDQYLRKAADFENFRKRVNREKQELTDFANLNLMLDLLPVIDDFERAIKAGETSKDFASFYEGVNMIEKRLTSQLENKWGLKRFDSEGQPFDPNRHEALQMEKAAGISEAVVKEDYLKGYLLKERVIRCAKVKVLMPESGGANAGAQDRGAEAPSAGQQD